MFKNEKPDLKQLYTVHVGNLNAKTTYEELKILFSPVGEIRDLFIQNKFSTQTKFTYAFVRFQTLEECTNACKEVHGTILHGSAIYVTLADSTSMRVDAPRFSNKSISKNSFPRKEGANYVASHKDENEIHKNLKQSLTNLQKKSQITDWMGIQTVEDRQLFMKDFKDVLVGMAKVPKSIGVDSICYDNKPTLKDLQNLIINHHSCSVSKTDFQPFKVVDIDLTTEEIS